jgi:molecular chaperone GrpE
MPKAEKESQKRIKAQQATTEDEATEQPAAGSAVAEPATEAEPADDVAALKQELEKHREQSEYHLEQWKRAAANLANYRKRAEKERTELLKSGQVALIAQLLPILDDFERAFQTVPFALSHFTWTEGLALIDRKLHLLLSQHGLKEIEALGKPFEPALHQALMEEETTTYADGHVMAVLQKGYILHDRVLRPAMVKIAKNESRGEPSTEGRQTESESADTEPKNDQATAEHEDNETN